MHWAGPVLCLSLAVVAPPGLAKPVHPNDPVAGHPGLTYLDLVRQAVPDLKLDATAGDIEGELPTPPPRHLGGKSFEGDEPDPVTLDWMEDKRIVAGGKRRMVILADLGPDPDRVQSQTLLLLFDDVKKPKLLDVVDVGLDKDTVLNDTEFHVKLGPGDDAIVTDSEHNDADISFDGRFLLFVHNNRFQAITDFYVINANNCSWNDRQTPSFVTHPVAGSPYADVDVRIVHRIVHTGDNDCGDAAPKAMTHTYHALFHWDAKAGRFVTTSRALKALNKLNGVIG